MVWLKRFEDGERAWCVFGCPELTGTGATGHAVDRECALLREVSLKFCLNGCLIQNLNFKSAQPNTNACFRPVTDAYNPTPVLVRAAPCTLKHTTQPVSCSLVARPPRASSRDCATGLFHTVLVVRVLFALSKSFLDDSQNPGPGALSLIKHICVHAFWNL